MIPYNGRCAVGQKFPALQPCTLVAILLTCEQASAKGGSFHTEDRYNPQHIDSLPPEIRSSIVRRCNTPKALHPFASYFDNSKRSFCILSISCAMETAPIAPTRGACIRSGYPQGVIFGLYEATMPRPAIELSRRYGKPAHGERGYSSTWRRGRAGV